MDPASKSKYLTPCRTFGLQRTQKRTPGSKGLTSVGGACLNTPFRSPLITESRQSTPSAEKQQSITSKSSWSTPLLPKSRVKMGLSKPSPKTGPNSLIQTGVAKSELPQSGCMGNKKLISYTSVISKPKTENSNRLHKNILTCVETSSTNRSRHESSRGVACNGERDGKGRQSDDTVEYSELPRPADENPESSEELELPVLSPQKPLLVHESISGSDSDGRNTGDSMSPILYKKSSLEGENTKLNSSSSQESFHGWDLEKDQESLDCDSKRDSFKKCLSSFDKSYKVESCPSNQHSGVGEDNELVSSKTCSRVKLSFVKEKFKSKRRLLSDSDDSDGEAHGSFSVQRKRSQKTYRHGVRDPLGSLKTVILAETKPDQLLPLDSNGCGQVPAIQYQNSDVPSSPLARKKCRVLDMQTDSEKENFGSSKNVVRNSCSGDLMRNKAKSIGVLSDSDDDDSVSTNHSLHVSGSSSVTENVYAQEDPVTNSVNINAVAKNTAVKNKRLLSDSSYDTDDCVSKRAGINSGHTGTREQNVTSLATELEQIKPIIDAEPSSDKETMLTERGDSANSLPATVKYVLPSSSDHIFVREVSSVETFVPDTSISSQKTTLDVSSKSCVEADAVRDSDDVRKPLKRQPTTDSLISRTCRKEDSISSKIKLVLKVRRLPESALLGFNKDLGTPKQNSLSLGGEESGDEEFPTPLNNLRTYGRAGMKKETRQPKKLMKFSESRHPSLSGPNRLSCSDESITLQNEEAQTHDVYDETKRRFVECVSETEDLERMKSEMQKWLVGGQQVISQIIEEVRHQRDKDMSVMEVLQEHHIDPDLVGYDPAVEEFISFDKFLLKNNLT